MTKNIKVNLSLIFCINKKNANLDKALNAIYHQVDKNVNLIFVFNGCQQNELSILKQYDFSKFNKVDYVFVTEDVGDVCINHYVLKNNIETKYEYQFNSNIILMPDFVSTINAFLKKHPNADIISFFDMANIYFKDEYLEVKTLADDFCNRPLMFFDNKILSVEYLKTNNIIEYLFKLYPSFFYVQLIKGNPKWYLLGRQISKFLLKPYLHFNIMDLFEQCNEIIDLMEEEKYFKNHFSEIEYVCIVTLFIHFTFSFFNNNKGNFFLQKKILNKIENFIDTNFPNWEKNEWLYSKKNKNDVVYLNYLRKFKPKLIYVIKAMRTKLHIFGYYGEK